MFQARRLAVVVGLTVAIAIAVAMALAIPESAAAETHFGRVPHQDAYGNGYDEVSGQYVHVQPGGTNAYHNGWVSAP